MHRLTRQLVMALVALWLVVHVAPVAADSRTIEINEASGAFFEGIMDGIPNGPVRDGTPDVDDFDMVVAFQAGTTEMRSVGEFPLADLADVLPEEIVTAKLTFNIDDVIGTFGPGSSFSGKASKVFFIHPYDADGDTNKADYGNKDETAYEVQTGGGGITDSSLNTNGAVFFEVDVRDRLIAAHAAGKPWLGFLWRTDDSPTATSIDNLGEAGTAGAGSRGSKMPFLTIEVVEAPPPPNCGNGTIDTGETCDDSNTVDGDCCSRRCELDAEGAACDDGDACTLGDACNAEGICQIGPTPRNCDDGEFCTIDSCDPEAACVNLKAHEGESCDDQNLCTTGDVCGAGQCQGVPVPVGGCDDGDACTVDDTCTDGVCLGEALCGNGAIDVPGNECNEQCDDGNTAALDGCSDVCSYDALLGNEKVMQKNPTKAQKSKTECLLQVALAVPILDASGGIAPIQRCTDGAPCDMDPAEYVCGFELATCLGQADTRLPACSATAANALQVKKPGKKDAANRPRIEEALANTTFPGCSEPIRISVRAKGGKDHPQELIGPGKTTVVMRTKVAGVGTDVDKVKFICDPPAS